MALDHISNVFIFKLYSPLVTPKDTFAPTVTFPTPGPLYLHCPCQACSVPLFCVAAFLWSYVVPLLKWELYPLHCCIPQGRLPNTQKEFLLSWHQLCLRPSANVLLIFKNAPLSCDCFHCVVGHRGDVTCAPHHSNVGIQM